MKTFVINGKPYTDKQLESAIRLHLSRTQGKKSLTQLMDNIPPEGVDPGYKEVILSIQNDPLARHIANSKLNRGIDGFGANDPLLNVIEFLVDLYVKFRRK